MRTPPSPLVVKRHLDFDLDTTLYFFTAGRYEYRNKGIDVFIESLSCTGPDGHASAGACVPNVAHGALTAPVRVRLGAVCGGGPSLHTVGASVLNEQLKFLRSNVTVVAFFITPAPSRSFTVEALKGQAVTKQLHDTVTEITHEIGRRIFDETVRSVRVWRRALRSAQGSDDARCTAAAESGRVRPRPRVAAAARSRTPNRS